MDAIMSFARKIERYGTWTAQIAVVDTNILPEKVEVIDLSSKEKRNSNVAHVEINLDAFVWLPNVT
jgi:hypothetical protein